MKSTERFANRAGEYVAGRPSYPAAAIDALLEGLGDPTTIDVADLGAGTGISSRALATRGCRVVAIEPNAAMRASATPMQNVRPHAGTAEETGLPSAAFDLVVAFQAFHWFDFARALAETARLLRPGGRAALVYNERDPSDAFTASYSAIARAYDRDRDADARRRAAGVAEFESYAAWTRVTRSTFGNEQVLDRAGVRARALSTSYLPKEGPVSEALQAKLDVLVAAHEKNGTVTMRMTTIVIVALAP